MIDPILFLALSMHSNKGIHALLLGSGISRSAGIPTGWEVTLDLIRKLARLQNQGCEPDPAAWYRTTQGEEPEYSKILDAVAQSAAWWLISFWKMKRFSISQTITNTS